MTKKKKGEKDNMMFHGENWEIIEREAVGSFTVKIYLIYRDSIISLAHIENSRVVLTEIKDGKEEQLPTFDMPLDAWRALKSAMIDKKVKDIKEVDAELIATKYHLEDMRKIVFK